MLKLLQFEYVKFMLPLVRMKYMIAEISIILWYCYSISEIQSQRQHTHTMDRKKLECRTDLLWAFLYVWDYDLKVEESLQI